jgi:glycogen synthase
VSENPLKICLVSSELTPLAKTGGLADVSAALSVFLDNKGHDMRVLIPFYSAIDTKSLEIVPDPSLQNLSIRIGNHHLNYSIEKHQGQIYIDLFRQILPTGK